MQVLTCAYLALIGNHRAYADAGLVAGAVPLQLAGTRVEEPRHISSDRIDRVSSNVVESAVRQCAGRESSVGTTRNQRSAFDSSASCDSNSSESST